MDLRNAIQYFGMDAAKVDCPFALQLLDHPILQAERERVIVDSRLAMLKPGWYPCIPGWHYDEIKRQLDGKLDWERNNPTKQHLIMVLDEGTGSLTEVAHLLPMSRRLSGEHFPLVEDYTQLNKWMEENQRLYTSRKLVSGETYVLTNTTPHRGTPATGSGWRYFIRATIGTQRQFTNETRTQTQVYIPAVDVGW